jgi:hypothetical protein
MGYGTISDPFWFIPRDVPDKPPTAPRNVKASTDRNTIYIEYDLVKEDGGAPILGYLIYMDDGLDGDFTMVYNNTNALTWDTSIAGLTLVTGNIYRLKYSCNNIHGEGPLSDEVAILVAEIPSIPFDLHRIDMESVTAGDVRMKW